MVPSLYETKGGLRRSSLLLIPLRALKEEVEQRLNEAGLVSLWWTESMDTLVLSHLPVWPSIILLSAESLGDPLLRFLALNSASVVRFIVEEVHLWVTALSYREHLIRVDALFDMGLSGVLLTATMPESLLFHLQRRWKLSDEDVTVVRSPSTVRHNIAVSVHSVASKDLASEVLLGRIRCISADVDHGVVPVVRVIVFCMTVSHAEEMSQLLRNEFPSSVCALYHSQLDPDTKRSAIQTFRSNGNTGLLLLCATSAVGTGLDIHSIRAVFNFGTYVNMLDGIQQIGRVGRDGAVAFAEVIHWPDAVDIALTLQPHASRNAWDCWADVEDYMFKAQCRRSVLTRIADGVSSSCLAHSGSPPALCDLCTHVYHQASAEAAIPLNHELMISEIKETGPVAAMDICQQPAGVDQVRGLLQPHPQLPSSDTRPQPLAVDCSNRQNVEQTELRRTAIADRQQGYQDALQIIRAVRELLLPTSADTRAPHNSKSDRESQPVTGANWSI
jgi:superfamily II DNA helicase RecQ